jgi:hypothetical protein
MPESLDQGPANNTAETPCLLYSPPPVDVTLPPSFTACPLNLEVAAIGSLTVENESNNSMDCQLAPEYSQETLDYYNDIQDYLQHLNMEGTERKKKKKKKKKKTANSGYNSSLPPTIEKAPLAVVSCASSIIDPTPCHLHSASSSSSDPITTTPSLSATLKSTPQPIKTLPTPVKLSPSLPVELPKAAIGALTVMNAEALAADLERKNDPRYQPIEDSEFIPFEDW